MNQMYQKLGRSSLSVRDKIAAIALQFFDSLEIKKKKIKSRLIKTLLEYDCSTKLTCQLSKL